MASVAAEVVRERLDDLGEATVLVIGAGKIAELVAANLQPAGRASVIVANRTGERRRGAGGPLRRRDGRRWTSWPPRSRGPTWSSARRCRAGYVVGGRRRARRAAACSSTWRCRATSIPAVAEVEGVTLINVDELEEAVRRNIALREGESGRAREIVVEQAAEFRRWLAALEVVPAITLAARAGRADPPSTSWSASTAAGRA